MQQNDISSHVYLHALHKIFGMRPSVGIALIEHFSGAKNMFSLSETEIRGLCKLVPECKRITSKIVDESFSELELLASNSVKFFCYNDPGYPVMLKDTNDFPIGLFYQTNGDIVEILNRTNLIGTIGGKDPYSYGIRSCHSTVDSIKKAKKNTGIITRSCNGIDKLIQGIATEEGIPSVAVIPFGFKNGEPICDNPHRAIITDIPYGEKNNLDNILRRDRIIAALARAILLVETRESKSCRNIIENAYSYGKEIWAFPGPVDWKGYEYNNKLIGNNIAEVIYSDKDLLEKIGRI